MLIKLLVPKMEEDNVVKGIKIERERERESREEKLPTVWMEVKT